MGVHNSRQKFFENFYKNNEFLYHNFGNLRLGHGPDAPPCCATGLVQKFKGNIGGRVSRKIDDYLVS